jgi:uncharacterized protein YifE (UPF0438 family)
MSANLDYFELSEDELVLLEKNLSLLKELDNGRIFPRTIEEKHFVDVCKGKAEPKTLEEIAYIKRKKNLIKAMGENSLKDKGSVISPSKHVPDNSSMDKNSITDACITENEEGYPDSRWFTDKDWKKGRAGQFKDMIENHKN